ncbi:acid ceramidase-like [Rhopilema esculentum]|uniref:acid ceramidase-like n=1 Tax=Rhopilema esculentum TaxID=499914 RepID=UPI0031D08D1B
MSLLQLLIVAAAFYVGCIHCQDFDGCSVNAYPPPENTQIKDVILNLDLAPKERWSHLVAPYKVQLTALIAQIKKLVSAKVLEIIDKSLEAIVFRLPQPYRDEIIGISTATEIELGEVVLYNIFYEIFTVCTSIVGQDKDGKLYHARNLDFGLFMGWDMKNNTWAISELLRPLIFNVLYQKQGKVVYKAVHFLGYVGIITGIKPGVFTLTVNERFALDGGYIGLIEWLLGMNKARWMGFLTRETFENANSFDDAKKALSDDQLIAPVYFILGGTKPGEGCVITRSRTKSLDVMSLDPPKGVWYVLETNYDHWKAPLFIDDRRTPANTCMKNTTQAGMGFKGLFNVLSTKPVLNKLTVYTALLQVDSGTMTTYRRSCHDPCWPW